MTADMDRLREFHDNQSLWLERLATGAITPAANDARIRHSGDASAILTGQSGVIMLPFATSREQTAAQFSELLTWLRTLPINDVLIWNMHQDAAIDLDLLAQGFRSSFEPWWMTRDLAHPIAPPTHQIDDAHSTDVLHLELSAIPYVVPVQLRKTLELIEDGSDVRWIVARRAGIVIGQAILNITGNHAGLFNVGVDGRHRGQGVGTSLTNAALQIAREAGVRHVNLNSTGMGRGIYESCGFRMIGAGMTWFTSDQVARRPIDPALVAAFRAIGSGDIAVLTDLPARFPNGMSPQQVAAHFKHTEMLKALIERGQTPEIMCLWDAGLRDEALAASADPLARELPADARNARPIHLAVERGAGTLVLALIERGADLSARDSEFRATPLDWAHACNKPTIARIIRQAGGH